MSKEIEFEVTGGGEFPFDMLRYDSAWPASEADSRKIAQSYSAPDEESRPKQRTVRLKTRTRVTNRRWESFGWSVVRVDHNG